MTSIQIVSDLHIEYKSDAVPDPLSLITPTADVLVLAGDIGSFYKYDQLKAFLGLLCPHFQVVLYVPGNHEYYTMPDVQPLSMQALTDRLHKIANGINNMYVLDRSSVRIGDVCIAGCTLWTKPEDVVPRFIVRVHKMNTKVYNSRFDSDLKYIQKMIKYCESNSLRLLMVTHHCPTYQAIEGSKKRAKYLWLYASHLDHLLQSKLVHTWVCGHIHKNFDFITAGGTRVVGNQKGKPKDKIADYSKNFTIEV